MYHLEFGQSTARFEHQNIDYALLDPEIFSAIYTDPDDFALLSRMQLCSNCFYRSKRPPALLELTPSMQGA